MTVSDCVLGQQDKSILPGLEYRRLSPADLPDKSLLTLQQVIALVIGEPIEGFKIDPDNEKLSGAVSEASLKIVSALKQLIARNRQTQTICTIIDSCLGYRLRVTDGSLWEVQDELARPSIEFRRIRPGKKRKLSEGIRLKRDALITMFVDNPKKRFDDFCNTLRTIDTWPVGILMHAMHLGFDVDHLFSLFVTSGGRLDDISCFVDYDGICNPGPHTYSLLDELGLLFHQGKFRAHVLWEGEAKHKIVSPSMWVDLELYTSPKKQVCVRSKSMPNVTGFLIGIERRSIQAKYVDAHWLSTDVTEAQVSDEIAPKKQGNPGKARARALEAAIDLWGKAERPAGVTQDAAWAAINEKLAEQELHPVSKDTVLRALGDRN